MLGMAALLATPAASSARLVATPRQSAGPFYPAELPLDDDNDLTMIKGRQDKASGMISDLNGRILDINGQPLGNLRIEIWQCDANGRYRHPHENGNSPKDEHFQGHGHAITDAQGRYRFRTIRPVPYPGRTPHIHIAVLPDDEQPFVTQLYVEGEPQNQHDFLFKRVPVERRHLVTAAFNRSSRPGAELEAQFDIILNRSDGTPLTG
jgi:protocatechuate 3,4-dioxygenase beta subunit